jgi:hypothetical protein
MRVRFVLLVVSLLLLAGCGTIVGGPGSGDPARGKEIFNDEQGMRQKHPLLHWLPQRYHRRPQQALAKPL